LGATYQRKSSSEKKYQQRASVYEENHAFLPLLILQRNSYEAQPMARIRGVLGALGGKLLIKH